MATIYNGALSGNTVSSPSSPLSITTYTSGSGTYTPVSPNSLLRVTLVGGGGGGGSSGSSGAGSGTAVCTYRLKNQSSIAWSVGVGGAVGSGTSGGVDGGTSSFGTLNQPGGPGGYSSGTSGTRAGSASACNGPAGGSSAPNQPAGGSLYGIGAQLGSTTPTGYGAGGWHYGGGQGTAGSGGLIIVEDFGV